MFGPADDGIEIPPFFNESGTKFLLHLLRMDVIQDLSTSEVQSAHELAQQVDGHAQAISVMAGLIQRRSWGIQEFLSIYEKNREYIHVKGRDNALSTIWKLSFESLTRECATLLGILAYISPDSIPQELFTTADPDSLPQRLRCCHDELDFHETVEPLLTQALVQRDKEEKTYAVHRLVQIQYRYHLTQQGRQEAFNQAVKLLFEGFGSGAGQLYDRWTHCQMYIQQIVSLKNNYKKEMSGADRLHPTLQFCSLLARSSRYLVEIADYVELEDLLSVALGALEELPRSETKQRINDLATIVGATGLLWGHRGFFGRAIPFVRRANKLQSEREDKNWNSLSWSEVNLGNVLASAGEYDEALEWELKAEETRKRGDKNDVIKSNSVVQQNIGRCYTFLDQFDKAASRLQSAASEFKDSKNWAMLAFTLFVQGTLERRQGNLEASKEAYTEAQQVWILGGKLKTHHFNGACMYKLGCISMDLGDKDKAMEHLRAALVVAKLKEEVMAGDYARVLHKLSVLLNTLVGSEVESAEMAAKALRIQREMTRDNSINFKEEGRGARSALATEMGDLGLDDSDEKRYDELVYILWR
ncbi:hypothetical protein CEP54_014315 [Fusarium duplospermum]|uniref:DUF7779 domain-containing protein n=1 Tax=Fusarium duplospermum TaxID=1325734 RepID=A0A428NX61_9HYPO|nr:hypothetical protein CEP54_014315 [Fusarium duplospermum]